MAKTNAIPVRLEKEERLQLALLEKKFSIKQADSIRRAVRFFIEAVKRDGFESVAAVTEELPEKKPTVAILANLAKQISSVQNPPLRDKREVAYYADSLVEAGGTSGTFADNPPGKIRIPKSWKLPVDFVIRVHGDSMHGFLEDGDLAAFVKSPPAQASSGQVVAALAGDQVVVKLLNDPGDGAPELHSINTKYDPIPCDERVIIQGVFQGPFPGTKKP